MDVEYAQEWYNMGMTSDPDLPTMSGDRIFLFKGKSGQGGAETTHDEIKNWIKSKVPPVRERAAVKKVDM